MEDLLTSPALRTFRDPAGSVETRPDGAYRSVRAPFDTEILDFLASPVATELVEQDGLSPAKYRLGRLPRLSY
jgi:hypothetical protein